MIHTLPTDSELSALVVLEALVICVAVPSLLILSEFAGEVGK